jgi:O-antigen/teichoic acid export membrane protein
MNAKPNVYLSSNMNLSQSIRTSVKWLVIGNTGGRVLEFAFGVILARLLVPADFGMIVTIQVFTGFVGMLTSGGMGQALIRAKEVDANDFNAVFTLQLALGTLIYLGFFLAAPWFADFFDTPLYEDLLQVSALSFLMRPFAYMYGSWLSREMDFKTRSIIGIISGLATGITSVLMAWSGMGVWSLTLSGLVGGLLRNILLARVTPLSLRLNFDFAIMRRHGAYGSRIVANDILGHVRNQGLKLILSKLAGPAFLGLFNKADSLHRLPYWMFGQPVAQPVFRAMSKVQDDLDQTKYMFYRVITLLMVYILPFYVGLWWVAEPFIGVVYGEQWLPAAEPLRILALTGFFYIISRPCGVLLMAQNRLIQEIIAQAAILVVTLSACVIGLNWGLEGVSWSVLGSQVFATTCLYFLVYRTIPTRIMELIRAIAPGLKLNGLLYLALALTDSLTGDLRMTDPALYLLLMVIPGSLVYLAAFLLLPIPALQSESARWRQKINGGLSFVFKSLT